jgi:hypothetical protein
MGYRLLAGVLLCCSAQAAELPWDLGYKSALRQHPAAAQEGWADWVAKYPQRPIHQLLKEYAGPRIESSLLIEQPGPHSSHTLATWIYTTRDDAQWCAFDERSLPLQQKICYPMERPVAQDIIREVMAMPDSPAPVRTAGAQDYKTYYFGFLSVYQDGKALQRPLKLDEWQRDDTPLLAAVMARAVQSVEELGRRNRD